MLTGRGPELAEVREALAARRPALVVGDAGMGKTTLLRAAAEAHGGPLHEGGALATLSWLAYLPLTRAIGHEPAGLDPQAVAHDVLQAVPGDGLLLLDDLQWAAPETWEVIGYLAGRVPLALGSRPEGLAAVPDALAEAALVTVELGPLADADAERLARTVRPAMAGRELAALLRRAGGSPLLVRELATSPQGSPNLRRAVGARLRALSGPERTAFDLLALAGRWLAADALVDELGESAVAGVVRAGLAVRQGDRIDIRHALLGEVAVEDMDAEVRRELHGRLGRLLTDPGEAARHLDRAGDREGSRRQALLAAEAARLPGERASHLRLAAVNSDDAHADVLRLAAAEALEAAHDWDGVFELLDHVKGEDPETVARVALLRARAAWSGARTDELRPALETGLAAVGGTRSAVETLLLIEACRVPLFLEEDAPRTVELGRQALAVARETGVGVPRAEYFLGTALAVLDEDEGPVLLEHAVSGARAAGDLSTEMTAANNLVAYHESSGSPARAAELAHEMSHRSHQLGLGYWETDFAYQALQLDFHAGRYAGLLPAVEEVLARPMDPRSRVALVEVQCMALVDLGRPDEAIALSELMLREGVADPHGAVHFWWTLATAALAAGRPDRALEAAENYLADLGDGNPNEAFGIITRSWALFELGRDPTTTYRTPRRSMLQAVPQELRGLHEAYAGRHESAAGAFAEAARLWAPYHVRGRFRCAWAAAEMLLRAGRTEEAVAELTTLEEEAEAVGLVLAQHRVRRTLRAAGQRRASRRTSGRVGLTGREEQVLALVAAGLTNDQIATRLGVARRTVVAQITSAQSKLGAENRTHAALLASTLEAEPQR